MDEPACCELGRGIARGLRLPRLCSPLGRPRVDGRGRRPASRSAAARRTRARGTLQSPGGRLRRGRPSVAFPDFPGGIAHGGRSGRSRRGVRASQGGAGRRAPPGLECSVGWGRPRKGTRTSPSAPLHLPPRRGRSTEGSCGEESRVGDELPVGMPRLLVARTCCGLGVPTGRPERRPLYPRSRDRDGEHSARGKLRLPPG
jgi:hypothetical protein